MAFFRVVRSGAAWRDLREVFGPTSFAKPLRSLAAGPCLEPYRTCTRRRLGCDCPDDRYLHGPRASAWRVHQHGACIARNQRQSMGRSVPKQPPSHPALAAACRWHYPSKIMGCQLWRSNKDKRLHLLCMEGAEACEALPAPVRAVAHGPEARGWDRSAASAISCDAQPAGLRSGFTLWRN
jgi:hypothetical protein